MHETEPIQAFRELTVPIDLGEGRTERVRIPFDVELLERVEHTLLRAQDRVGIFTWLRRAKGERNVREVFEEFCKPYLPRSIDLRKVQPMFAPLFFSAVRDALSSSIAESAGSTKHTGG